MTSSRALARAGLIVSGAFLISRLLGWVRVIAIVNGGLSTSELDAFFAAFRLPDLMFQLVAAGALSSAVIPIVSALLATEDTARAWRVVSTIANLMLAALLLLAVVVFIAAPVIIPAITPGFTPDKWSRTVDLTRIMVTLGVALMLREFANRYSDITGGADGLQGIEMAPVLGMFRSARNPCLTAWLAELNTRSNTCGRDAGSSDLCCWPWSCWHSPLPSCATSSSTSG